MAMTEPGLYGLVYFSRATGPMSDDDLAALLRQARGKNHRLRVTGMLLFESGLFMQVLEGPREAVLPLFQRIAIDPRHRDVTVVVEDDLPKRLFGPWEMAFHRVSPSESPVEGFSTLLERYRAGQPVDVDSRFLFSLLSLFVGHLQPGGGL